ncbi:MAG: hypothetical protein COB04_10665 [Gammaproteobacteria bacterium]|nr:MAG: hypothetical protein COB04_10665 [Gammaproteobacteria bacterium]
MIRNLVILCCVGLFVSHSAVADTVSGTIEFLKKPPLAGLLYLVGGKQAANSDQLDQKDKKFTKDILVRSAGGEIVFNNSDSVDHNIFANDTKTNAKFDVGLMATGNQIKKTFDWPIGSMIRIGCKIHPKMKSYIVTTDSVHYESFQFKRSGGPYSFSLTDIPSQQNEFILSIPRYDPVKISLNAGESKTVVIIKKGKEKGSITISRE